MTKEKREYLIALVEAGKSLSTIEKLAGCGTRATILKRLKAWGMVDKDTTIEDCLVEGWGKGYKKVQERYSYEMFKTDYLPNRKWEKGLARELDMNRHNVRYAIKKYKQQYFKETGIAV